MSQILVVAVSAAKSAALVSLLRRSGYRVALAAGYDEAIQWLADQSPDLLISQVYLGAFNGLRLVIRGNIDHPDMRAILLDRVYDQVIEFDAKRHGATYLVEPVGASELLAQVSLKLAEVGRRRRWPRKQPAGGLVASIVQQPARVVDLSYGGFRLEVPQAGDLPPQFHVTFPGFGVAVRARPVWTRRAPSGWLWCGAELSEVNPQTQAEWRRLVDSVHDSA